LVSGHALRSQKGFARRVSGFGLIPAKYDAKAKVLTYAFTQKLAPKAYTVIVSARVKGQRVEAHRNFTLEGTYSP
jgi:hypothetical protein